MASHSGHGSSSGTPDHDDKEWFSRAEACKRAVCFLLASVKGNSGASAMGTGWVVRNDAHVAALVTARHVVKHYIGTQGTLTKTVRATFDGGHEMDLTGLRVLGVPVPDAGADTPEQQLDLVAIVLPCGLQFPSPPVPCKLLDKVGREVDGSAECTLLHGPDGESVCVVSPGCLVVLPDGHPDAGRPWMLVHSMVSSGGSSGGMLVDHQCRAVAVHIGKLKSTPNLKGAVLLGALHAGLRDSSPWHGLGNVAHEC